MRDQRANQAENEVWLMLAFPGSDTGHYSLRAFAPSKNGKSWFRILPTRESAIACKRELVADGIKYVCKKVQRAQQKLTNLRNGVRKKNPPKARQWNESGKTPSGDSIFSTPVTSLRRQQIANFELYKRDMASRAAKPDPLPEPKNGPSFGRSPGLSKSGAPARHINDTQSE